MFVCASPNHRRNERGNVPFLILIAVALFAALSYAVTSSSRSGGNNTDRETIAIETAEVMQYLALMKSTVERLRVINNCADTELSFAHDSDGDGDFLDSDDVYHHNNAPIDFSCHIFHPDGGALSDLSPKKVC